MAEFTLPPLPYDYSALEPHIDTETMKIHHDKHHQAYVDKVNAALAGTEWAEAPIEDVIRDLQKIPEDKRGAVRNNGGGHPNHTPSGNCMSPEGGGHPSGDLAPEIDAQVRTCDALHARARAGELKGLTGVDAPYEPPENPDLVLDTAGADIDELVAKILEVLDAKRRVAR